MPRILRQTTVIRDGYHNAFTDLQYWQGAYWVAYRKAWSHIASKSQITIAVSNDRQRFNEVANIHLPDGGDIRDPKLISITPEQMAMVTLYSDASHPKGILNPHDTASQISFSKNGCDWETPIPILKAGQHLFRVRKHQESYWGLVYEKLENGTSSQQSICRLLLMKSGNLLDWEQVSQVGCDEYNLNESDIDWDEKDNAIILARTETTPGGSYLCHAEAPYVDWNCRKLDPIIHAPTFLRHDSILYAVGRSFPYSEGDSGSPFTHPACMALWTVQDEDITNVLRIPAAGDCSYPGLICDPEGRVCMTYYSQHAYYGGVFPPPVRQHTLVPYSTGDCMNTGDCLSAADIYFAELLLP